MMLFMMGRAVRFLTVSYSTDPCADRCTNGRARRTPHDRAGACADRRTGPSISAASRDQGANRYD